MQLSTAPHVLCDPVACTPSHAVLQQAAAAAWDGPPSKVPPARAMASPAVLHNSAAHVWECVVCVC